MFVSIIVVLILAGLLSGICMFWKGSHIKLQNNHATLPLLSIIIPARNEAKRLPILLDSLFQQKGTHFEVLVVDDASEDRTSEVAKSYGVTVLKNATIKNSASGKSIACAIGAKHAKGKWLMFLDADVQFFSEDSLKKLLSAYANQQGEGILSVQPYHKINHLYESLSVIFNIIVAVGINRFTLWGNRLQTAGAFGPCIMCAKKDYEMNGGHMKIQNEIMDDFALSELFMENGMRVTNYLGKGTINLRMYPEGMHQLVEGWTKNLATASQSTHKAVMGFVNLWILGAFIPLCMTLYGFIGNYKQLVVLGVLFYVVYGLQVMIFAKRVGNFNYLVLVFYPLFFIFFTLIFLYSLYRTKFLKYVWWKGRKIQV